jgi:hypothetical protein
VPGTSLWPQVIVAHSEYDVSMIARHLER